MSAATLVYYLPPEKSHVPKPHTLFEEKYGWGCTAGLDEAGYGPWAGPVVAAAVVLFPSILNISAISEVRESKLLSESKRRKLVELFTTLSAQDNPPLIWRVGSASAQEIDVLNVRQANFLAMERALKALPTPPQTILVDGLGGLVAPVPVIPVVKGDRDVLCLALASLFAKVTRDAIMDALHGEFPWYGWASNKGYGTLAHRQALKEHGVSPHHRKSYKPLQNMSIAHH